MNKPADTYTKTRLEWCDRVIRDRRLSTGTFETGYLISGLVNRQKGYAYPGLKSLAATLGVSERTVRRQIEELVRYGYLTKKRRGDGETNGYWLQHSDRTEMSDLTESRPDKIVHSEKSRPDISRHSDRTFGDIQTGQECPPISLKNSLRELSEKNISVKSPLEGDLQDEFEELWERYPRKVSKGGARKAFKVARKRASFETLLAGVQRYASERKGQDEKYTKHFSTWLTGECWGDETSPHRQAASASGYPRAWQSGKDRNSDVVRKLMEGDE